MNGEKRVSCSIERKWTEKYQIKMEGGAIIPPVALLELRKELTWLTSHTLDHLQNMQSISREEAIDKLARAMAELEEHAEIKVMKESTKNKQHY